MLMPLIRQSRLLLAAALLASVAAGVSNVAVVALINQAIALPPVDRFDGWPLFAAAVIAAVGARMIAGVLFQNLSQGMLAHLRRHIAESVLASDFRKMERIGAARIQAALTDDASQVSILMVSLPAITTNAVVVIGCLIYLATLSFSVFLYAVAAIFLGAFGYHLVHVAALAHLRRASHAQGRLFEHFSALVAGAKELKMNRAKRGEFSEKLLADSIESVRSARTFGMSLFCLSAGWGSFLIFAFIGLTLFVLSTGFSDQARIATGFALLFLFMVTPLEVLLNNIPQINLALVAARRIEETVAAVRQTGDTTASVTGSPRVFRSLRLADVTHSYYSEQADEVFTLGPVNIAFDAGEIVFLVGGNGSGKTSLAKILCGLYVPTSGSLRLDNQPVSDENRDACRQLFSAIFSDFYLFESLIGAGSDIDVRGNQYLERLHLNHKVTIRDGAFSARDLSQGQRKRLALVAALLEDRPFLLFDEWAADQDPQFKDVFYNEVLADLKSRGKTVLVISHDDRYFHLADRVLHMRDGQIVSDRANPASAIAGAEDADTNGDYSDRTPTPA